MGLLTERYKRRSQGLVNPAGNPDNYTFYSASGDPADMVPIQAAKGARVLEPYLNGMTDGIPERISVPGVTQRAGTQMKEQPLTVASPRVDSSDAIGSLARLMGPTPAEREARDRRMQRNKAQMAAWTGLFDGLRHLGNLYYTTRGAAPQRYSNPYAEVDRLYNENLSMADRMDNYRRQYAQQLYNMRRQADDDARRNKLAEAQAQYYGTRDEMARLKAENDRLRNEAAIRNYDARTKNTDAKTATEDALRDDRVREIVSRINRNNKTGAAALIRANKTGTGRGRSGGSGKGGDPYEELADHLQQNPDVVGPILQEEGIGVYDKESKKFTFTKNATKGMATTANRRTRQQVSDRSNKADGANKANKTNKSNRANRANRGNNGIDNSKLSSFSIHK